MEGVVDRGGGDVDGLRSGGGVGGGEVTNRDGDVGGEGEVDLQRTIRALAQSSRIIRTLLPLPAA